MKIQILSDIHTEFGGDVRNFINNDVDITVIAGDLGTSKNIIDELIKIDKYATHPVVFVPGNHDYYHSQKCVVDKRINNIKLDNIIVLNNDVIKIQDIVFIGGTGWFQEVSKEALFRMSDFKFIHDIIENNYGIGWNSDCYKFFNKALNEYSDDKVVCITHNMPSFELIDDKYTKQPFDALNGCFAMHWDNLIEDYNPDVWVCGHTHTSFDKKIFNTRIICNPYRYYMKDTNKNFNPNMVIEL